MFLGETAAGPAAGEHAGSVRGTAGAAAGPVRGTAGAAAGPVQGTAGAAAGPVWGTAGAAAAGHPLYSGYRVPAFWQAGAKQVYLQCTT